MRTIRSQRHWHFGLYWLGSSVVLLLLSALSGVFGLLFTLNAVLGIVFRRRIVKLLVNTGSCYAFGAVFDLGQSSWICSCGYQRAGSHVFDRCPQCRCYVTYFPCPRCQTSLDV